jgi:DNA polymerase III delta prime subunit
MAKEIIFKTINNNGEYSCGDIGISTSDWYGLLLDKDAKQYIDVLLCFLREPEHTGSCKSVSKKYGNTAQHYNSKITSFSKWVQKTLNRFQVKGTDGKDTYWCITMKKGWESEGVFLWQMRDELVKALQRYLMKGLIQNYRTKEPFNGHDEEYKWALLDKVEGKDVQGIINCLRGQNVVYNAQVDGILKTLWETKPDELATYINDLLDETRALTPRIENFRDNMPKICPSEWKAYANDERTASAILTCRYPNEYTFYKSEVYQVICKFFGFEYRDAYLKYAHFIEIINDFVADFGEEIQQIMMPQIGKYKNKPLNLAVQTLFWCMKEEMKESMRSTNKNSNSQETMPKPENKYKEYIDLLETNKNLILTGAPGTGKTYMAKEIAKAMGCADNEIGFVQFHPSYDYTDFVEGLRPKIDENGNVGFERRDGVFKEFCKRTLHAYRPIEDEELKKVTSFDDAYDALIRDLRKSKKELEFDRVRSSSFKVSVGDDSVLRIDGTPIKKDLVRSFYEQTNSSNWYSKHCELILDYLRKNYYLDEVLYQSRMNFLQRCVLIIDEINRGEISKIFGELFYSIDPGYRGEKGRVCTQYQNMIEEGDVFKNGFYVPENVYIIGTMNDIDRSVENMDFAMRRRFTWKEITPTDTAYMLDKLDCAALAKATMTRLNKVIEDTEGLGAAYMIGPAYFLKLGENGGDFNKLWEMNIKPLLKEYLRGFRKAKEILDRFKKAYFNQIDED